MDTKVRQDIDNLKKSLEGFKERGLTLLFEDDFTMSYATVEYLLSNVKDED